MRIRSDNSGQHISNELKYLVLPSRVIHELTLPYLPESNRIAERFDHLINPIQGTMTFTPPDFPFLWAEAANMAAYL
jgi:hypothetical protein